MPVLKSIAGHGPSVRPAIEYLMQDDRAVAVDYVNCQELGLDGEPVWQQMDQTRKMLGTGTPFQGHRAHTWQHFIVSPSPGDNIDLMTLRDLTQAWVKRYFGDFQAAIYYHDDNVQRIPHAHIIVNNANLARPGGRLSTTLKTPYVHEIFDGLQDMAYERGLSTLSERQRGRAVVGTSQPTYRTARDIELEGKGISWKQDVRTRISCAIWLSETEREYVDACRALGLSVRISESKRNVGEYVYGHPVSGREVTGSVLGRSWSRASVRQKLQDDLLLTPKPSIEDRERLLKTLGDMKMPDGTMSLQVIGTTHGMEVTSAMVASMLETCGKWDIRSIRDFDEALGEASGYADTEAIADARDLALELNWLPDARDAYDGYRLPHDEYGVSIAATYGGLVGDAMRHPGNSWEMPERTHPQISREHGFEL